MNRTEIINMLIQKHGYGTYLEIGIDKAQNFDRVVCKRKLGVDPSPPTATTQRDIRGVTSDVFFAGNDEKFDIVFIDGLHHADQVERDIRNSLAALNEGGVIVCHDMLPTLEAHQIVPRQSRAWTGDVWKTFVRLRSEPDLEMFVVDTDMGCGIIRKGRQIPQPKIETKELTFENFQKHKQQWMNIISVAEFRRCNDTKLTAVVVAYKRDSPERERNLRSFVHILRPLSDRFRIIVAESGDTAADMPGVDHLNVGEFFSRCHNFNRGWEIVDHGEAIFFADSDILVRRAQWTWALQEIAKNDFVKPFDRWYYASAEASTEYDETHAWRRFAKRVASESKVIRKRNLCGGIVGIRRSVLDTIGGWDERFVGHGGEDNAMDQLARKGPFRLHRVRGSGFHSHHPTPYQKGVPNNRRVYRRDYRGCSYERIMRWKPNAKLSVDSIASEPLSDSAVTNRPETSAMITTIFIHHKNDDVTRHHWKLVQENSGSAIALSATSERMEGQQSIQDYPEATKQLASHVSQNPSLKARSTDLILVEWFKAARPEGDSFFIVEWDTLINMPVAEFVKPVADCPISAATTRFPNREPEWSWFKKLKSLPTEIQDFACGVMPFTCIHVSRHALSTIADAYPSPGNANGELRFGTVANANGFRPVHNPNAGPEITWKPLSMFGADRMIYHPVKRLADRSQQQNQGAKSNLASQVNQKGPVLATALLLNYRRPENLPGLIKSLRDQSVPVQIWLANNGEPKAFSGVDRQVQCDNSNGCYQRWMMGAEAQTPYVFSIDDDLLITDPCLIEKVLKAHRFGITGGWGKRIVDGTVYRKCPEDVGKADIVKGKFAFVDTELVRHMVSREYVERLDDDIYLSSLVDFKMCHKFVRDGLKETRDAKGLENQRGHYDRRNSVMQKHFSESQKMLHLSQ